MEISQLDHWRLLLVSSLCGVSLGLIYEILRTVRTVVAICLAPTLVPRFRKSTLLKQPSENNTEGRGARIVYSIVLAVLDILFFVCAAVLFVLSSYSLNHGRFRWMIFVGILTGFLLYRVTLGIVICFLVTSALLVFKKCLIKISSAIRILITKMISFLSVINPKDKKGGKKLL